METIYKLKIEESFSCYYCGEKAKVIDTYQDNFAFLLRCESCKAFFEKLSECEHNFGTFKFQYSEGMIQVITRCIKCGKFKKAHKKKDFNLATLEFYDNTLENEYNQNLNKARRQFFSKQDYLRLQEKKLTNAWTIQKWYEGYLNSKMWRRKRAWIFKRSGGKCERCGNPAKQVHHKTYERLGYEAPEDLMAVCMSCHGKEHSENPGLDVVRQFKLNDI